MQEPGWVTLVRAPPLNFEKLPLLPPFYIDHSSITWLLHAVFEVPVNEVAIMV